MTSTREQLAIRAQDFGFCLIGGDDGWCLFDIDSNTYFDRKTLAEIEELLDNAAATVVIAQAAEAVGFDLGESV